jgi:hypothetical protein
MKKSPSYFNGNNALENDYKGKSKMS